MNDAAQKIVVTIAVLSGTVLCQLGDSLILLDSEENQAFASEIENRQIRGAVVATTYFSVKIKSEEDGLVTFYVPENDKLAKHEVGQLLTGDQVTILWSREERRNWVRDVAGEGVHEGKVTALGDAWIEVQHKDRRNVRYRAPWRGGNPADGGGLDREVVRKLGTVRVGDQVAVTWAMPDGKRVMNVAIRERGERSIKPAKDDLPKASPER